MKPSGVMLRYSANDGRATIVPEPPCMICVLMSKHFDILDIAFTFCTSGFDYDPVYYISCFAYSVHIPY